MHWTRFHFFISFAISCFTDLLWCLDIQCYNHPNLDIFLQQSKKEFKHEYSYLGENLRSLKHSGFAGRSIWKKLKFHQFSLSSELPQIKVLKVVFEWRWKSCCWKAGCLWGEIKGNSMSRGVCMLVPCLLLGLDCWMCLACLITSINKVMG